MRLTGSRWTLHQHSPILVKHFCYFNLFWIGRFPKKHLFRFNVTGLNVVRRKINNGSLINSNYAAQSTWQVMILFNMLKNSLDRNQKATATVLQKDARLAKYPRFIKFSLGIR